jgi:5-methylcytosine-specific restriction endonuclease McrA
VTGPQRFHVQFMAGQEYVELVERAQALLSHALPQGNLAEVQLRAMRALVAELEKAKYGAPTRTQVTEAKEGAEDRDAAQPPTPRREATRSRGRHIPAAVRRAVRQRDRDRCTYVDSRGQRCRETHYLELHHLQAFAHGGPHTAENLTLRCRAHNTLAAEEVFGREVIQQKKCRFGD